MSEIVWRHEFKPARFEAEFSGEDTLLGEDTFVGEHEPFVFVEVDFYRVVKRDRHVRLMDAAADLGVGVAVLRRLVYLDELRHLRDLRGWVWVLMSDVRKALFPYEPNRW